MDDYSALWNSVSSSSGGKGKNLDKFRQAQERARSAGFDVPDDIIEDFYDTAGHESGRSHYTNRGNIKLGALTPSGERAIGFGQIMPSTARPYQSKGLDPYNEIDNIAMSMAEFYRGDPKDPIARRLAYVGGSGSPALAEYRRTGQVPRTKLYSYLPGNKETYYDYLERSGGFRRAAMRQAGSFWDMLANDASQPFDVFTATETAPATGPQVPQGPLSEPEAATPPVVAGGSVEQGEKPLFNPATEFDDEIKKAALLAQRKQITEEISRARTIPRRKILFEKLKKIDADLLAVEQQIRAAAAVKPAPETAPGAAAAAPPVNTVADATSAFPPARAYTRRDTAKLPANTPFFKFEETGDVGEGRTYLGMAEGKHYAKDADGEEYELLVEGDGGSWRPVNPFPKRLKFGEAQYTRKSDGVYTDDVEGEDYEVSKTETGFTRGKALAPFPKKLKFGEEEYVRKSDGVYADQKGVEFRVEKTADGFSRGRPVIDTRTKGQKKIDADYEAWLKKNDLTDDKESVKKFNAESRSRFLAKNPEYAKFAEEEGRDPFDEKTAVKYHELQNLNAKRDAARKRKVAAVESQVGSATNYDFVKKGELVVPGEMGKAPVRFKYDKERQYDLRKGQYRLSDEDGTDYIFSPSIGKFSDEADETVVKKIELPLPEAGSVTLGAAKRTQAGLIADAIAADYPNIPEQDIVDYFAYYGFSDFNSKEDLPAERFFKPSRANPLTGVTEETDFYNLTQRDVNRMELFSKERAASKGKYEEAKAAYVAGGKSEYESEILARGDVGWMLKADVTRELELYREHAKEVRERYDAGWLLNSILPKDELDKTAQGFVNFSTRAYLDKYGSFRALQEENDRISKLPTSERIIEAGRSLVAVIPKAFGAISKSAAAIQWLLPSIDPNDWTKARNAGARIEDSVLWQGGKEWDAIGDWGKNEVAHTAWESKAADTVGQVALQAGAAWATSGIGVPGMLGLTQGGSAALETAMREGATPDQQFKMGVVGAVAAMPDLLLMRGWFKSFTGEARTGLIRKIGQSVYRGLVIKGATSAEASMTARLAMTGFVTRAGQLGQKILFNAEKEAFKPLTAATGAQMILAGSGKEGVQEWLENDINLVGKKYIHNSSITWADIAAITDEDVESLKYGMIGGAFGGTIQVASHPDAFKSFKERRQAFAAIDKGLLKYKLSENADKTVTLGGQRFEITPGAADLIASYQKNHAEIEKHLKRFAAIGIKAKTAGTFTERRALVTESKELGQEIERLARERGELASQLINDGDAGDALLAAIEETASAATQSADASTDRQSIDTRPLTAKETVTPGQSVEIEGKGEGLVVADRGKSVLVETNPIIGADGEKKYQGREQVRKTKLSVHEPSVLEELEPKTPPAEPPVEQTPVVADEAALPERLKLKPARSAQPKSEASEPEKKALPVDENNSDLYVESLGFLKVDRSRADGLEVTDEGNTRHFIPKKIAEKAGRIQEVDAELDRIGDEFRDVNDQLKRSKREAEWDYLQKKENELRATREDLLAENRRLREEVGQTDFGKYARAFARSETESNFKEGAPAVKTKQAFEMSRDEYDAAFPLETDGQKVEAQDGKSYELNQGTGGKWWAKNTESGSIKAFTSRGGMRKFLYGHGSHHQAVGAAVREGGRIDPAILADYPALERTANKRDANRIFKFQADERASEILDEIARQGKLTENAKSAIGELPEIAARYEVSEKEVTQLVNTADTAYRRRERKGKDAPEEGSRPPHGKALAGKASLIRIPGESGTYDARFAVREAGDIHPSHNAFNFNPNPEFWFVNDRHYDKQEAYQASVIEDSLPNNFQPDQVVNNAPTAELGPPVIDADGNVLGGNSRSMKILRIFGAQNPKAKNAYIAKLKSDAAAFGLEVDDIAKFNQPVLVREVVTPGVDKQAAIADFNKVSAKEMSVAESAISGGTNISEEALQFAAAKMDETGQNASLTDMLNAHGLEVVERLIKDGVFSDNQKNSLIQDGQITSAGKEKVKRLLLGKLFEDLEQMEYAPASVKNTLERIIVPLIKTHANPTWDILPFVREAIDLLTEHAIKGKTLSLEQFTGQQSIVRPEGWTPRAAVIAAAIRSADPVTPFRKYAGEFRNTEVGTMFGELTPEQAFLEAFGVEVAPVELEKKQVDSPRVEATAVPSSPTTIPASTIDPDIEPWKMTRSEFLGASPATKAGEMGLTFDTPNKTNGTFDAQARKFLNAQHRTSVEAAVGRGEDVPRRVLSGYRDLAKPMSVIERVLGREKVKLVAGTVDTASASQGEFGRAATVAGDGSITAVHQTNDPEQARRAIASGNLLRLDWSPAELGTGLYASALPELWMARGRQQIELSAKGKFIEFDKDPFLSDGEVRGLFHAGYAGAFTRGSDKAHPEVVFWDAKAVSEIAAVAPATLFSTGRIHSADFVDLNYGVDQFVAGTLAPHKSIEVGPTPEILRRLGMPELSVGMGQALLHKTLKGKHKDAGITPEIIKDIPGLLEQPIAVITSDNKDAPEGSLLVVTRRQNLKNEFVAIAVHPNRRLNEIEVNKIASLHPKDLENAFYAWFERGQLFRYLNKKWGQELAEGYGSKFAALINRVLNPKNNVLTEKDFVKKPPAPNRPVILRSIGNIAQASRSIFYSQLERVVEEKMPNRASVEQIRGIIKDVKAEERQWLGIDQYLDENPSPTKAEVLAFVRSNAVNVQEVEHGQNEPVVTDEGFIRKRLEENEGYEFSNGIFIDPEEGGKYAVRMAALDDGPVFDGLPEAIEHATEISAGRTNKTKYSQFTLPGGENYRELLLTLPANTPADRERGFGMRGEMPTRLLDEYQSRHFDEPNILAHVRFDTRDGGATLHIAEIQSDWHQAGREKGYQEILTATEQAEFERLADMPYPKMTAEERQRDTELKAKMRPTAVPDAPFKKTAWAELALKRMIRYAAENGYKRLTWDVGEAHAERYSLQKEINAIKFDTKDGVKSVIVDYKGADVLIEFQIDKDGLIQNSGLADMEGKKFIDAVGKEIADRIAKEDSGLIESDGLKVGGEGMKAFYDQILPAFVNRYTKKWGGKVFKDELEKASDPFDPNTETDPTKLGDGDFAPVHSLGITPAMRESVMQGQPLFRLKTDEDADLLYNVLPFAEREDIINEVTGGRFNEEGELELGIHDAEFDRWLWERVDNKRSGRKAFSPVFEGVVRDAGTLRALSDEARSLAEEMGDLGYSENQTSAVRRYADNLSELATLSRDYGLTYVFDEALPEERFHQEDLRAGRTDAQAIRALQKSPIWHFGGKFAGLYGKLSNEDKASEIVAKLATGQERQYGWDAIEGFAAVRKQFYRDWGEGLLRNNAARIKEIGLGEFFNEFKRIGVVYVEAATGDAGGSRTDAEPERGAESTVGGVRGDQGGQPGDGEAAIRAPGASMAADGVEAAQGEEGLKERGAVLSAEKYGVVDADRITGAPRYYKVKSADPRTRAAQEKIERLGLDTAVAEASSIVESLQGADEKIAFQWETVFLLNGLAEGNIHTNLAAGYKAQAQQIIEVLAEQGTLGGWLVQSYDQVRRDDARTVAEYIDRRRRRNGVTEPLTEEERDALREAALALAIEHEKVLALQAQLDELRNRSSRPGTRLTRGQRTLLKTLAERSAAALTRINSTTLHSITSATVLRSVDPPSNSLEAQILDDLADIGAAILFDGFYEEDVISPEEFERAFNEQTQNRYAEHWRRVHAHAVNRLAALRRQLTKDNAIERIRSENPELTNTEIEANLVEEKAADRERAKLRAEHRKLANEILKAEGVLSDRQKKSLVRQYETAEKKKTEREMLERERLLDFLGTAAGLDVDADSTILAVAAMLENNPAITVAKASKRLREIVPDLDIAEEDASQAVKEKYQKINDILARARALQGKTRKEQQRQRDVAAGKTDEVKAALETAKRARTEARSGFDSLAKKFEHAPKTATQKAAQLQRMMIVSAINTAANNMFSGVGTRGMLRVVDVFDVGIQKTAKLMGTQLVDEGLTAETRFMDVLGIPQGERRGLKAYLQQTAAAHRTILAGLDEYPELFNELYGDYSSDIESIDAIKGSKDGVIHKVLDAGIYTYDKLNFANRWQEYFVRDLEALTALQMRAGQRGLNLSDMEAKGELNKLTTDDWRFAVERARTVTFARRPEFGTAAYRILHGMDRWPIPSVLVVPFAKFSWNAWNLTRSWLPIVAQIRAGRRVASEEGARITDLFDPAKYTSREMANSLAGFVFLAAASALVAAFGDRDDWYYLRIPGTDGMGRDGSSLYVDVRQHPELVPFIYLAHKFKRWGKGQDLFNYEGSTFVASELGEAFMSLSYRQAVDQNSLFQGLGHLTASAISDADRDENKEKAMYLLTKFAGERLGIVFSPARPLKNVLDTFATPGDVDLDAAPFMQGFERNLPNAIFKAAGFDVKKDLEGKVKVYNPYQFLKPVGLNIVDEKIAEPQISQTLRTAKKLGFSKGYEPAVLPEEKREREVKREIYKVLNELQRAAPPDFPSDEKRQEYYAPVNTLIDTAIEQGVLTESKADYIRQAIGKSEIISLVNKGGIDNGLVVYETSLTDSMITGAERAEIKNLIELKINRAEEVPDRAVIEKAKKLGLSIVEVEPPLPVKNALRELDIKTPGVGDKLTLTEGGKKEQLTSGEYAKYKRETLERVYQSIGEMLKTEDYIEAHKEVEKTLKAEDFNKAVKEMQALFLNNTIKSARTSVQNQTRTEMRKRRGISEPAEGGSGSDEEEDED